MGGHRGREKLAAVHPVLAINKVRGRWPVALKAAIGVAGPVLVAALLLELEQGANQAMKDDPQAVAVYRPMVADVAALGYAVLGACWHPEAGLAQAGAARASSALEAITRHPVSQHRTADELAEDVAVVRAELQRWS